MAGDDIHDHSTTQGKMQIFLNRINWRVFLGTLGLIGIITLTILGTVWATGSVDDAKLSVSSKRLASTSNILKKSKNPNISTPTDFIFDGSTTNSREFSQYENFTGPNQIKLESLTVKNAQINCPNLTESLKGAVNLKSITLTNVWLIGNCTRVFLPKLTKFTYQQSPDDPKDSYKSPETLRATLFFDKSNTEDWTVQNDLLNLGVVIKMSKGGTQLLDVNRYSGEVYLNINYCEDVLKGVKGSFKALTLIGCNLTDAILPVIPTELKYLNLRNFDIPSGVLSSILKSQTTLEEFYGFQKYYCDWPGYELSVNLSDLPPTAQVVSVNNLNVTFPTSSYLSSIPQFSIGDWVNEPFLNNFEIAFSNLKQVATFNISKEFSHALLDKILKTKAEWIAMIKFERFPISKNDSASSNSTKGFPIQYEMEKFLNSIGVPENVSDFLIEFKNDSYRGRGLGLPESNYYRYSRLGFNKMDTLEDYVQWDAL